MSNFKKHLQNLETLFSTSFKPLTTTKRLEIQNEIKTKKVPVVLDHYYNGSYLCWTDLESLDAGWLWDAEEYRDNPEKLLTDLTKWSLSRVKSFKKRTYYAEKDGSYIFVVKEDVKYNQGQELLIFQIAFDCENMI